MPYTNGSADDYHDLLDQLRTWLTGTAGWTELQWTAPGSLTDVATLNLQGPGAGVDNRVYINIRSQSDETESIYSWEISGATGYDEDQPWGAQPNESSRPFFNLWENSIDYWFYANDRRFVVVAKTSTTYASMYAGFFLPWATPAQYPFPLYVAGDYYDKVPWNQANAARRFFPDPGGDNSLVSSGYVRGPDGIWLPIYNNAISSANDSHFGSRTPSCAWTSPYTAWLGDGSGDTYTWTSNADPAGPFDRLLPTAQSERVLIPISIQRQIAQPLGVIDGAYAPLGTGLTTEQHVVSGSRNFRAFQNINRNSGNDFMLLEEVA
jgi:hypothetical protein